MIAEGQLVTIPQMYAIIESAVEKMGMPMDAMFVEFMDEIRIDAGNDDLNSAQESFIRMVYQRAIRFRKTS